MRGTGESVQTAGREGSMGVGDGYLLEDGGFGGCWCLSEVPWNGKRFDAAVALLEMGSMMDQETPGRYMLL